MHFLITNQYTHFERLQNATRRPRRRYLRHFQDGDAERRYICEGVPRLAKVPRRWLSIHQALQAIDRQTLAISTRAAADVGGRN